jgi:hypothetical protein
MCGLLSACGGGPVSGNDRPEGSDAASVIPSEEPSIRGTITAAGDRSVRVEANPADQSGSAKALVRLGSDTPIRFMDGSPAEQDDLVVGVAVSVWFTGPVAESYPVQASAGVVRIDSPRQAGSPQ